LQLIRKRAAQALEASDMVTRSTGLLLLVLLAVSGAGCEVIGGIFKAGVWVGGLGVILVLILVAFVVMKVRA
jgi:hypothetical protein